LSFVFSIARLLRRETYVYEKILVQRLWSLRSHIALAKMRATDNNSKLLESTARLDDGLDKQRRIRAIVCANDVFASRGKP
jgi:hypothetical protein